MASPFENEKSAPLFDEEAQTFRAPPTYTKPPKDGKLTRLFEIFASGPLITGSRLDRIISLAEAASTPQDRKAMMESIQSVIAQEIKDKEIAREYKGTVGGAVGELLSLLFGAIALVLGFLMEVCCMLMAPTAVFLGCCILPAVLWLFMYGLTKL